MKTSLFLNYSKGSLKLEWEAETLTAVVFCSRQEDEIPLLDFQKTCVKEFREYFEGKRQVFSFLWKTNIGTDFEKAVWQETAKIPYGKTVSYGEIAKRMGRPKAFRAVGRAMGRNPLPIVVPCHRVLSSAGNLHGFTGGLETKSYLLTLEGALETAELSASKKRKGASLHAAA